MVEESVSRHLLCENQLLWLEEHPGGQLVDLAAFRRHWTAGLPVIVSGVLGRLKQPSLWRPDWFGQRFRDKPVTLFDCSTRPHEPHDDMKHSDFWNGFDNLDGTYYRGAFQCSHYASCLYNIVQSPAIRTPVLLLY